MPYKVIEQFDAPPLSLLWGDQDVLWTTGRDGFFNECDVSAAPRAVDRKTPSAMAFTRLSSAIRSDRVISKTSPSQGRVPARVGARSVGLLGKRYDSVISCLMCPKTEQLG